MSRTEDRRTAERWLMAAEADLAAARALLNAGFFAHACFTAQQCGEKALKALWHLSGEDAWGHSIQKLAMQFPGRSYVADLSAWIEKGARLDRYYIPTRYPNGLPDLTPAESYFQPDAEEAINLAAYLLAECRRWFEAFPPQGWPSS